VSSAEALLIGERYKYLGNKKRTASKMLIAGIYRSSTMIAVFSKKNPYFWEL